jgi:hypothetical protein
MLHLIHATIESLLRAEGDLPPGEVDVSFEMPGKEWLDSLLRPTLNCYLFDIEENTDLRQTAMETMRYSEHEAVQRMPPRRFDLHYMVSALTSEAPDSYELLWGSLAILLRHNPLPPAYMPRELLGRLLAYGPFPPEQAGGAWQGLFSEAADTPMPAEMFAQPMSVWLNAVPPGRALGRREQEGIGRLTLREYAERYMLPLVTSVGRAADGPRASELWGALELPPRPALFLVVTAPVELGFISPIWRRTTGAQVGIGPAAPVEGTVRDGVGVPLPGVELYVEERRVRALSDERGGFMLRGLGKGTYTLRITRPSGAVVINDLVVPSDSYDIILL